MSEKPALSTPKEHWDYLNKCINCKHYIGPNRWKSINDALAELEEEVEEEIEEEEVDTDEDDDDE